MNMCIDYDTDVIPDSERAKTSVLSQQSDELLRECWKTWRLSAPYRAVLYLELVKTRFDENKLDLEDIKDASRALDKVIKENDPSTWAINDVSPFESGPALGTFDLLLLFFALTSEKRSFVRMKD